MWAAGAATASSPRCSSCGACAATEAATRSSGGLVAAIIFGALIGALRRATGVMSGTTRRCILPRSRRLSGTSSSIEVGCTGAINQRSDS